MLLSVAVGNGSQLCIMFGTTLGQHSIRMLFVAKTDILRSIRASWISSASMHAPLCISEAEALPTSHQAIEEP